MADLLLPAYMHALFSSAQSYHFPVWSNEELCAECNRSLCKIKMVLEFFQLDFHFDVC